MRLTLETSVHPSMYKSVWDFIAGVDGGNMIHYRVPYHHIVRNITENQDV